uniref:Uncharacterized protein n=1 Tax=Knipowitschia caucasica TaxID=637954 RepID=A0AAV2LFS5_KNICA
MNSLLQLDFELDIEAVDAPQSCRAGAGSVLVEPIAALLSHRHTSKYQHAQMYECMGHITQWDMCWTQHCLGPAEFTTDGHHVTVANTWKRVVEVTERASLIHGR